MDTKTINEIEVYKFNKKHKSLYMDLEGNINIDFNKKVMVGLRI